MIFNFKKTITILVFTGLALSIFSGCKKGSEDPFFSVRSRNARIKNEWKLTKVTGTNNQSFTGGAASSINKTYAYSGTDFTIATANTIGGSTISSTETYSGYTYTMLIDDEGKLTITEGYTNNSNPLNSVNTGTWTWLSTDESKEHIALFSGGGSALPSSDGIWHIKELKNKELIIDYSSSVTNSSSGNQDVTTENYEFLFTGK